MPTAFLGISESETSGSDYSATVAEEKKRRREQGGSSGPSDDEDMPFVEEGLDDEDVNDGQLATPPPVQPRRSAGRKATARIDKGKGRAQSPHAEGEVEDRAGYHKRPGPFSAAAKAEIAEFSSAVLVAADSLAEKYGKTRREVMIQAGLGSAVPSRAPNAANVHRKWYSVHYPKPDSSKFSLAACIAEN